jgi:hypothetical protein
MKKGLLFCSLRYATLVWLTAVIAAPIFYFIFEWIFKNGRALDKTISLIVIAIPFGALCSIPSWLLLIFSTYLVNRRIQEIQAQKVLLFVIAYLLTFAPFFLLNRDSIESGPDSPLFFCYWVSISFGIIFYDLKGAEINESPLHH